MNKTCSANEELFNVDNFLKSGFGCLQLVASKVGSRATNKVDISLFIFPILGCCREGLDIGAGRIEKE